VSGDIGATPAIASSEPSIYNEYSPDLLEDHSYIAFKGNEFEVRLDLWRLDRVAVGQVEASEDLEEVSQGACISSGPNYKPRRDWSEEAITAAQNEPEAPNDTVVTIRDYAKYLGERERRQ